MGGRLLSPAATGMLGMLGRAHQGGGGGGGRAHPVGLAAVEEVLGAHGAGGKVAALVGGELREVHAAVALHAVAGVQPQPRPPPAQVAVGAVVDLRPRAAAIAIP